MAHYNITLEQELLHELFLSDGKDAAFSKLMSEIFNQVLKTQSAEQLGAAPYERTNERQAYRNGFRTRALTTRIGTLTLHVPRHRNGQFSTSLFQRYQRSEQALMLTMMEMVINGVSTRKVEIITEELCGKTFSKSTVSSLCKQLDPVVDAFRNRPLEDDYPFVIVDAIYLKARQNKRVCSVALLVCYGINSEGYREILGFEVAGGETENSWGNFFNTLKQRGLKSPRLIVSDNHAGLVKAIKTQFVGTSWQRCQTHFSRNILDVTPKKIQSDLKDDLKQLYDAKTLEAASALKETIMETYAQTAPKAMTKLDEAFDDITAVLLLPKHYRKRLRTTNGIERLNQEIRRRERVIRIFPNEASILRLLGALLIEHDEKWSTGKRYFDMTEYYRLIEEEQKTANAVTTACA